VLNNRGWIGIALVIFSTATSWASPRSGEDVHTLSVSGGIAAPGYATAVFQNPAGLIYSGRFKLNIQGALPADSLSNPTVNAGLQAGGSWLGGTAGVSYFQGTTAVTSAFYGLAVMIPGIKTGLGFSGSTGISPTSGSSFRAGALFAPSQRFSLGVTALGLPNSISEWGVGVQVLPFNVLGVVLDSTVNSALSQYAFQPGLILGTPRFAFTASYGFGGSSSQLSQGFTAGLSFKAGSHVTFQAYHSQLSRWFAGLSIIF